MSRLTAALLFVALGSVWATAQAQPQTALIQGTLANLGGPVPDGKYAVTLRLYLSEDGGAPLWEEVLAAVQVTDGVFSAVLGATEALPLSALDGPLWLAIGVSGEPELPRRPLHSVIWALRALHSQTADVAHGLECTGCIAAEALGEGALPDLTGYAKLSDLTPYAKLSDLPEPPDLTPYAKLSDLPEPPDLSPYARLDQPNTFAELQALQAGADLSLQQVLNARLHNSAEPPAECTAATSGLVYLDTDDEQVRVCMAGAWHVMVEACGPGECESKPVASCQAAKTTIGGATSGSYWLKPGAEAASLVHCEMTLEGGGWTHVATLSNVDGTRSWSHTDPQFSAWLGATTLLADEPSLDSDYKSVAYGSLPGTELMLVTDKGVHGVWTGVGGTLLARIDAEKGACNAASPAGATLSLVSATVPSLQRDLWINVTDGNSAGSCALSNPTNPSDSAVLAFAGTKNYGISNGDGWQGIGQSWEQNIKNTRPPAVTCDTTTDCFEDFVSGYGWEQAASDETFVTTALNNGSTALEPDVIRLYIR